MQSWPPEILSSFKRFNLLLKLKVKPWLRVKMVTLEDLSVKWSTDRMKVINTYECLYAQVAYCMDIELDLDVVMEKLYRVFDNYSSAYMAYVDELEMDIDKSCYTNKSSLRDSLNLDFINMNNKMRDAEKRVNIAKKLAYAVMKQDRSKENEDKKDEVKQSHKCNVGVNGVGESVRDIDGEFGDVVVSFPRNRGDNDKVSLKGAKNYIAGAIEGINKTVKNHEDMVTIDCEIEQQYHETVKGPKLQKITTDFNVQIKFPNKAVSMENGEGDHGGGTNVSSTNPNIIKITGQSKNCAESSKALLELVPITAKVSVPFEFHRFIIVKTGIGVRDMMNKFDVDIHPARNAKSDIILISGVPTNVDSAKEGLAEKVAEHRTALFAKDVMMDGAGVTKVHRFKGFTSRWCTKNLAKGLRKVTLSRIQYSRARHKGYHRRTETNKKIYRIGKGYKMKNGKLTKGSFLHHDKVMVIIPNELDQMKPFGGECEIELVQCGTSATAQLRPR